MPPASARAFHRIELADLRSPHLPHRGSTPGTKTRRADVEDLLAPLGYHHGMVPAGSDEAGYFILYFQRTS